MVWTEKYRPETLKDFIGNRPIVRVASKWLEGWFKGKVNLPILILHGRSGIGKTTLSHCLAHEFGCAISELNASDERNVNQMRRAIQLTGVLGLELKRRLTIFDEADSITKAAQKVLVSKIKIIRQPIIMLVNDMDKISKDVKKISIKLEMKKPTKQDKYMVAMEVVENEGLDPWHLDALLDNSESYRDLLNNLYIDSFGEDFKDDFESDKLSTISAMLNGVVSSERLRISPEELLRFVYQNKISHILRDIDVWLTVAKRTGNYRLWAHAFAVLELQRYRGAVHSPRNEFKRRNSGRKTQGKTKKMVGSVKKVKTIRPKATHTKSLLSHL